MSIDILIFLPPVNKPPNWWAIAIGVSIFAWLIALIIWNIRKTVKMNEVRANAVPICVWKFTETEWAEYARNMLIHKRKPKGSAEIQVTEYDIGITDGNGTVCQQINGNQLAMTDCRITEKGIKARIRSVSYAGKNSPHYKNVDFYLPIPHSRESDAIKIIDAWKEFMSEHSDVIAEVTPTDNLTGLFGENDF